MVAKLVDFVTEMSGNGRDRCDDAADNARRGCSAKVASTLEMVEVERKDVSCGGVSSTGASSADDAAVPDRESGGCRVGVSG